ncbi:MAG: NAD-dependent epimerase/dehydratase family protein, partial [Phycisphaerae bacterium]
MGPAHLEYSGMMANIFVTGGAGFIGSHLCEALLERGDRVTAYDNFDDFYDPAVKRRNLDRCRDNAAFDLIEGDLRDAEAVEAALRRAEPEAIIHLAARAGVRPSIADPLLYQDVNVGGTAVLLEAVRLQAVPKFIFGGSSSVYGNNEKIPFAESDPVDHPISPYAATKKAGELLCHTYHHLYGTGMTCLRFFTAYGPRQRPDLAIHKFARLILAGRPIPVYGDGATQRDYTYVADIVEGVLRAVDRCAGYRIYNLGESQPV